MTILQKTLPFDAPAERARVTFTGRTFDVAEPILAAHDAANPGFCERACAFIRDYLRTHGRSAGEVIVAAGTEAGIVARDSRAWGVPFRRLSQAGEIVTVEFVTRLRGHGTSGGRVWALVNQ